MSPVRDRILNEDELRIRYEREPTTFSLLFDIHVVIELLVAALVWRSHRSHREAHEHGSHRPGDEVSTVIKKR